MKVLNVGGGSSRELPQFYAGWEQVLLDIDSAAKPDIQCDALEMKKLPAAKFDAIYSSHCLEHFYKHDVPKVLDGFLHVLKDDGFAEVSVPNLTNLFDELRARSHDISDVWYRVGTQPITFHDVLYGWDTAMANGNLYYAHKCGFTALSFSGALYQAGFKTAWVKEEGMNLRAFAYKKENQPCP
jgi:SAM-dependent methyltransferase